MYSSTFQNVIGMSLILAAASYGVGITPLSVPLSKNQLLAFSTLGNGLLIGTALGVILPEGIEQLVTNAEHRDSHSFSVGLPILMGFFVMFLLEEYAMPHGRPLSSSQAEGPIFDVDLEERGRQSSSDNIPLRNAGGSNIQRAYPLTFGLIIHSIVDGYALGVSASNVHAPNLSLIVFLAIIVHKAPTALALTTALLANSLSVTDCKKHLLYFSLATPVSTLLSYGLHAFRSENRNVWSGSALLFSGGTFLYVASLVQPMSGRASDSAPSEIRKMVCTVLLFAGMFFPVLVGRLVVHVH